MAMSENLNLIFIAYRREDSAYLVDALCSELKKKFGETRVFQDEPAMHAGNWRRQIDDALKQCCVMLVVIGPQWLSIKDESGVRRLDRVEDVHRWEIATALSRENVTVIPVRADGVAMPKAADLPIDIRLLADQQSRELSVNRDRRTVDMQRLFRDIQTITGFPLNEDPEPPYLQKLFGTTTAICILSLAIWLTFDSLEMSNFTFGNWIVVVVVSSVAVLFTKHTWAHLKKKRGTTNERVS
jgi:hypothetical protein